MQGVVYLINKYQHVSNKYRMTIGQFMARTLIAGPWIGEFGWELFAWHAYIRALSEHFDKTIVISKKNSEALYEDFASEFIAYNPPAGLSDSYFMYNVDINKCFKEVVNRRGLELNNDTAVLLPRRVGNPPFTHFSEKINFGKYKINPSYKQFGEEKESNFDYVFHIRNRDLRKEDNWNKQNWNALKNLLKSDKIACIGTTKESGWIDGTADMRGLSLRELFDVLRNSKCVFGPSSGPMHLASLCGAKHVVWGDQQKSLNRYEENWNPFETPMLFLGKHKYHPTPQYVYESFNKWEKQI